ncbi:hypothetical protein MMG03_003138 [Fibrobacter succinogenes]|nr:hypothetical protein [Fibrobacter succinogenes]
MKGQSWVRFLLPTQSFLLIINQPLWAGFFDKIKLTVMPFEKGRVDNRTCYFLFNLRLDKKEI